MADVIQNTERNRFELLIGGEVVGFTQYVIEGNTIDFVHTEVDPNREERGLGSELVEAALNDIRDNTDYRVQADCPFVAHWLTKHPDYQPLLSR